MLIFPSVVVASIIRLALIFNQNLADPTCEFLVSLLNMSFLTSDADGLTNTFIWSDIETDVAVLCANLPTLRPVLKRIWPFKLVTMYGQTSNEGLKKSNQPDEYLVMPKIMRSKQNRLQSLDGNGYFATSVTIQGDVERGKDSLDGIHVQHEVRNEFNNI